MAGPYRARACATLVLACCGLWLAAVAGAQQRDAPPVLRPGPPVRGVLRLPEAHDAAVYASYRIEVPEDAIALRLELVAPVDLDLYVDAKPIVSYDDVLVSSAESTGREAVRLSRDLDPPLQTGTYYVDVAYGRQETPTAANGRALRTIPFTLTLSLFRETETANLVPGRVAGGTIDPRRHGPVRTYALDVPAGSPALRIDLLSDAADLDLRLRRGAPMVCNADAEHRSAGVVGCETIVLTPEDGEDAIPAGRYYIDVIDPAWLAWPSPFRLLARLATAPPERLLALPELRASDDPLERAVQSTVELIYSEAGGSGVLISPAGHILTNQHVVEAIALGGENAAEPLLVAVTTDPHRPPVVRFTARVLASDPDLDLALLQIEADIYGRPLPEGYRFPTAALGRPETMRLADGLLALGYPNAGGLGTRVSITASRGILSGFERRGQQVHFKTDAEINAGNSGGPVLDERFEVIGIATETISDDGGNGQIGYVRPLWLVPEAWWRRAGIDR